jgi:hypothetical protein
MIRKLKESNVKIQKYVKKAGNALLVKLSSDKLRRVIGKTQQTRLNNMLIEAAKEGRIVRIERLLKAGANVNAKDREDRTALMWAASEGKTKSCKILIDKGADMNARDRNKWNVLMHAKANRKYDTAEYLLKAGAREFSSTHKF